MKKYFLVILIASLAIVACGKKAKSDNNLPTNDTNKVAVKIDSIGFEVDTFHVYQKDPKCKEESCTTCDLYYEKIKSVLLPVHDSVNRYIDTFLLMAFSDISYNGAKYDLKKIADDFITSSHDPDLDPNAVWDWTHSTTIIRPVSEVITVSSNYGGFVGGAHGMFSMTTANFWASNGKRIWMKDLFTDVSAVNKMAVKYFKKDNELDAKMDMSEQGWDYSDADFKLNENFDISLESIIWQFNSYEIGPYVNGAPSVSIPMKELEKYLKVKFTEVVVI